MKQLRDFTSARVDLERAGSSVATKGGAGLRGGTCGSADAVHHSRYIAFTLECEVRGWPVLVAHSMAPDRAYLSSPSGFGKTVER